MPEGIDEACVKELGETGAFLVGEARGIAIGFGACQVDFLVCDVEVAAEDDGFCFGKLG